MICRIGKILLPLHEYESAIMKYKIHQEGKNILLILAAAFLLVDAVMVLFVPYFYVTAFVVTATIVVYLILVNFFRSPRRHFDTNGLDADRVVVAPADGVVVVREEVYEGEYFHDRRMQVSIFMSLFNVHANWTPVNGTVKSVSHQDGRFLAANLPKSSIENERSHIVIETRSGCEILMRQVAGACARRIVTYADAGEACTIDEHIGFIKFGSRVDLYLPLDSEIMVDIDQRAVGNQTVVAYLPAREEKKS